MPKCPDPLFEIPCPSLQDNYVVDLLGGVVRKRPPTGEEALEQRNRLKELARQGDPLAQARFARTLLTDNPNARKNQQARRLLTRAARTREPLALYLLGLIKLRAQGCAADHPGGVALIEEAALLGNRDAARDAGKAASLGIGQSKDPAKALYWWRLAGAAGDTRAQRQAGRAYRDGLGAPRDYTQAQYWLEKAAHGRDQTAQFELARLLLRRDNPHADKALSDKWMKEAALSGILEAQYRLGVDHWSGRLGRVDLREALRWTSRAAEGGNTLALTTLAGFFLTGNALPINRQYAYVLLKAAQKLGDETASMTLMPLNNMLTYRQKREAAAILAAAPSVKKLIETLIPRNER